MNMKIEFYKKHPMIDVPILRQKLYHSFVFDRYRLLTVDDPVDYT